MLLALPHCTTAARSRVKGPNLLPSKIPLRESAAAFCRFFATNDEAEQHHQSRLAASHQLQPYVLVIGEFPQDIQRVFVSFLDHKYCFDSILKAIDVCFKLFYVLNFEYPLECEQVWFIVQQALYDIPQTKTQRVNAASNQFISFLRRNERYQKGLAPQRETESPLGEIVFSPSLLAVGQEVEIVEGDGEISDVDSSQNTAFDSSQTTASKADTQEIAAFSPPKSSPTARALFPPSREEHSAEFSVDFSPLSQIAPHSAVVESAGSSSDEIDSNSPVVGTFTLSTPTKNSPVVGTFSLTPKNSRTPGSASKKPRLSALPSPRRSPRLEGRTRASQSSDGSTSSPPSSYSSSTMDELKAFVEAQKDAAKRGRSRKLLY